MADIEIDLKNIKPLLTDLANFAEQAVPFATRSAINTTAFDIQGRYRMNARNKLTLRNKGTEKSIQVERAKILKTHLQEARIGSERDYMKDVEFGVTTTKNGQEGVPIPTSYSANQPLNQQPRTKLPIRSRRMRSIQMNHHRVTATSRKQRNFLKVKNAAERGSQRFVYLDLGRRKGIFRVEQPKRRPNVRMVYDLSRPSVTSPAIPLLGPATQYGAKRMPKNLLDAIKFQVKRRNLFHKIKV